MSRKLTIDEVKCKLRDINPNIEILDDVYVDNHTKLKCKCLIDGREWGVTWGNLQQGRGCPECKKKLIGNKLRFTIDDVERVVANINQNIKILSNEYVCANIKLKCKCLIDNCNHEWHVSYSSLKQGHGCPKCAKVAKLTMFDVKSKIKEINPNILVLSEEYESSHTKLKCKCLIDGNEWSTSWKSLQRGCGCLECAKNACVNNSGYNITLAERNKVEWVNKKTNVYLIKCYNENETFYKIGIAKNVKARFSSKKMPYEYTVLKEVQTNLYDAVYLEKELHYINKEFSYTPQIKFDGYTECFSQLHSFDIDEYV